MVSARGIVGCDVDVAMLLAVMWPLCGFGSSIGLTLSMSNGLPISEFMENGERQTWFTPYDKCNVTATVFQIHGDRAILTTPRDKPGVPFSLGVVRLVENNDQPNVSPFPSWQFNKLGNCRAIQNAVDIKIVEGDRVWVLDDGLVNSPWHKPSRPCHPKLVVINIETGEVHYVKVFNETRIGDWQPSYLFTENRPPKDRFVYILDSENAILTVINERENEIKPPVDLSGGDDSMYIWDMALVRKDELTTYLFFGHSGSDQLLRLDTKYLRVQNMTDVLANIVKVGPVERGITFLGNDNHAVIFFKYIDEPDMYTWNINTDFTSENFKHMKIGNDSTSPSGVAADNGGNMWVMWNSSFKLGTRECTEQGIRPL